MQNKYQWIDVDAVIDINKTHVSDTGEPFGILDIGKLDGAVNRPISAYFYNENLDVLNLGVMLMISIADAHAFIQGNKRTGFTAGSNFLNLNGYDLHGSLDSLETARKMLDVIEHKAAPADFESWLEPYVVTIDVIPS